MFKNLIKLSLLISSLAIANTTSHSFFEDITSKAGLPTQVRYSIVIVDYNGDGLPDILTPDALFENITSHRKIMFRDVTAETGLKKYLVKNNVYLTVADLNNDGRPDIITNSGFVLLQTPDHRFIEHSKELGLHISPNTNTLSIGDLNGDGWVDIIAAQNENYEKSQFFPPQVFLNNHGISFTEVSHLMGFDQYPNYSRGIIWADFDNDRQPDIFFSNYRLRPNSLFKGHHGVFKEESALYGVKGIYNPKEYYDPKTKQYYGPMWGHSTGSVWADFNNDGNLDLWVSKLAHKYVGPANGSTDIRGYVCDDSKIYQNMGAPDYHFVDRRKESGIPLKIIAGPGVYQGDELWYQAAAADFDNDGKIDMFVSQVYNLNYANSFLFQNLGNFKFKNIADEQKISLIDSISGVWADFDNDGKMDLITAGRSALNKAPQLHLFHNVIQNGNHYLKIKLIGTKSGQNPITTQVRVFTSIGLIMRQYEGTTGTVGQQNDPVLHFGLGPQTHIQKIEIRWSSGATQVLHNIQADQLLTITEKDESK